MSSGSVSYEERGHRCAAGVQPEQSLPLRELTPEGAPPPLLRTPPGGRERTLWPMVEKVVCKPENTARGTITCHKNEELTPGGLKRL